MNFMYKLVQRTYLKTKLNKFIAFLFNDVNKFNLQSCLQL